MNFTEFARQECLGTVAKGNVSNANLPIEVTVTIPQWQDDFCRAHAVFNGWYGICPCTLDGCLISKMIDSDGDIDEMRGLDLGQGITTDRVIDEWLDTGEQAEELFRKPLSFICMAEYLAN